MANRLLWQGHTMYPLLISATAQPWCGHVVLNPLNSPAAGCVTTTPASAKILPPPTGMLLVVPNAPLDGVAPAPDAAPPLPHAARVPPRAVAAPAPSSRARRDGKAADGAAADG